MKKIKIILWLLFFGALMGCARPNTTVFKNANVINIKTGEVQKMNILVEDGFIRELSSKPLKGTKEVDLTGSFVMDYLFDMHAHLHGNPKILDVLWRFGVLGIRDTGAFTKSEIDSLRKWSRQKAPENMISIVHSGNTYNGERCGVPQHRTISTKEQVIEAIKFQKEMGAKFIKIHNCFPKELITFLTEISARNGIRVIGHIPEGYEPIEYMASGISSVEHTDVLLRSLSYLEEPLSFVEAIGRLRGEYLDSLAISMKVNEVAQTMTLVAYENFIKQGPEEQQQMGQRVLKELQKIMYRLYKHDVLLLAGTDFGIPGISPGLSLWRELELISEGGLSAREALSTATVNPRHYLGLPESNLTIGGEASFLIIEKNPLESIQNLKSIRGVVKEGMFKEIAEH